MSGEVPDAAPASVDAPPVRLAPLREELTLLAGPALADGSPSWTLHDQVAGRFYRLGWLEFEILRRWHLEVPQAIAADVASNTTLRVTVDDVMAVSQFLALNNLLQRHGPQAVSTLMRQAEMRKPGLWQWLLKNYLFFRVPLVKPDRFLTQALPYVSWIFTRGFFLVTLAAALFGIYLVTRQWDQFRTTFVSFLSPSGLITGAVGLAVAKVVHELGHALTAKRYGCRVQTMGIAFMVMYPLLYTDVSDAWRLPNRRQRLAIGVAGMGAELTLAAYATLAWSFLPEGPVKAAAFLLATTSWIMTVLVNTSPFMRFDGYFLLSDLLDVPNLHDRAFALGRWWLRERLFHLGEPVPEELPAKRRNLLIALAFATWIYRFTLFVGIAALVYHLFFKVLGIILFLVEVWWFILRPPLNEVREWIRRRGTMTWNRRSATTAAVALGLLALAVIPWRSTVTAPAVLRAAQEMEIFLDQPGRMDAVLVKAGQSVAAGQELFRLSSPDLDYKLASQRQKIQTLQWEAAYRGSAAVDPKRQRIAAQELETAQAELRGLEAEKAKLTVTAPFAGIMAEVAEPLSPGEWLPAKERLGLLLDPAHPMIEAYVREADLHRVAVGDRGRFRPDQTVTSAVDGHIQDIDDTSTRVLTRRYLASTYGGDIAAREDSQHQLVPEESMYRVLIAPAKDTAPASLERGRVTLEGVRESLLGSLWRRTVAILLREGSF
ncbi:HlyD family efflux transporter periplasmic adaptor subunit [Nitrospirillum viridazoti]|uniref:Hemolysin D n=1 Tax=Nitrospirillum viridazoti CBAmc TaxID=1441467 RepID=A0A248K3K2_9PROT|nr:HlyD family efflux transporter periplasmic adaptor subunit [Nitrospirillum amazonense]ASG25359.1 hemolysin D [Nitrospirillum amazonense CBAmc]TWB35450.1 putative peptide zinc metalloprotease protein [Nitrospirillum amazonense]